MECLTIARAIDAMSRRFGVNGIHLAGKIISQNIKSAHKLEMMRIRDICK